MANKSNTKQEPTSDTVPNQDSPTPTKQETDTPPEPSNDTTSSDANAEVDWSELFGDEESYTEPASEAKGAEEPAEPPASKEGEPQTPHEPQTPPAEPETPSEPEQPLAEPQKPESKEEPSAQPPQEPQQPKEPAEPEPDREKQRQEAMDYLAKNYYALGEDVDKRLEEEPRSVLSELAGRLHVEIYDSMMHTMQQMLPQFIQAQVKQMQNVDSFQSKFYSSWENLKGHEDTVEKVLQYARQINPNATEDQLIEDAGMMATVALKLPIPQEKLKMRQTPQQPAAPQQPTQKTEEEPNKASSGYSPAGAGGGTPQTPPPQGSVWEEFLEE